MKDNSTAMGCITLLVISTIIALFITYPGVALILVAIFIPIAIIIVKKSDKKEKKDAEAEARRKETPEHKAEMDQAAEYARWFNQKTKDFFDELSQKGFNASWGFEVTPDQDYMQGTNGFQNGNVFIFDVLKREALAFDTTSKTMIYARCKGGFYKSYKNHNSSLYSYVLIPFSDIFNVKVTKDAEITYQVTTSANDAIARGIVGGIIGGGAGAIIGSSTGEKNIVAKTNNIPKKVELLIQTSYDGYPVIKFTFRHTGAEDRVGCDTRYNSTGGKKFLSDVSFNENKQPRKCNTTYDYIYQYSGLQYANLENALNGITSIATKIEAILHKNSQEPKVINQPQQKQLPKKEPDQTNPLKEQMKTLNELHDANLITDEEFAEKKKELLAKL